MALRVPDISHWQNGIDIHAVIKASDGVILKASEANDFRDKCFGKWAPEVAKSGKPFGFYHFFRGNGNEANWFLKVVGDYIHKGQPIIDVEVPCKSSEIRKFVEIVHDKTGKWCWLYTSAGTISSYMDDWLKRNCSLWCAGYPKAYTDWVDVEFPYSRYTSGCKLVGWQFTDKLKMAGKKIDASIFYISEKDWMGSPESEPVNSPAVDVDGKSILYLAAATMAGQYGAGDERRKRLGSRYQEVQDFINHIFKAPASELAKEVAQGKYGNGNTRQIMLGDRYREVQDILNGKKDVDEVAKEVIQGKWGNYPERKQRLEAKGYDYSEVQKRVNQLSS